MQEEQALLGNRIRIYEKWNYGIDLLRIIAMVMIPILHILGQGGILENAVPLSGRYMVAWLLEISCYCAVNVYGMISGYVGYRQPHNYARLLQLYFQVAFYTIIVSVLFRIWKPEMVSTATVRAAVFPFAYNVYWYFTAYFCLFVFMPFLDKMIDRISQREARVLIATIIVFLSVLPTMFQEDFGGTNGGYNFLWLAMLYLIGACLKKLETKERKIRKKYLSVYLLSVLIVWGSKMAVEFIADRRYHQSMRFDQLISYTSPFIIFCAIGLVLFFRELRPGRIWKKLIAFFTPVSFDVYLFHEEPLIVSTFLTGAFIPYLSFPPFEMAGAIIGSALVIWLAGSAAGCIRRFLFRIFRIEKLSAFLVEKTEKMFRCCYTHAVKIREKNV